MRTVPGRKHSLTLYVGLFLGLLLPVLPGGTIAVQAQGNSASGSALPAPVSNGLPNFLPKVNASLAVQDNGVKISEIVVLGNKVLNKDTIILYSGKKVGDPYTDKTPDEMQTAIFQTGLFGYVEGRLDPEAVKVFSEEVATMPNVRKIVINVVENPEIKTVQVTGSGPIKPEEIQKMIKPTPVYNEIQFARDISEIQDKYAKLGYNAVIAPAPEAGPDQNNPSILNVPIIVTRVVEIKLARNKKTRDKVILREMKTKVGDFFNPIQIERDRARIFNLDLFEEVTLSQRELELGKIGLVISIPEKRTGQVLAGVGFSNRQQLIGFAQIGETNFRGMGDTINLRWETGGIASRNTIDLGYTRPWLDNRHTTLSVNLYDRVVVRFANTLNNNTSVLGNGNIVGNDTRYFEQRTGGTVTVSRPFHGDTYRAGFTVRGENVRANALALDTTNALILQNGPIATLGGVLTHDTRDVFLDPASGGFQALNVSVGVASIRPISGLSASIAPDIFGRTTFARSSLEMRQFISLAGKRKRLEDEKSTLALRLQLGISAGRLPFYEQYFTGGAESLRGYREDRFWGSYQFLGSVELRQPLARRLKGVLFLDVGSAWGGPYSSVNIASFSQGGFRPHIGVGAGIRVGTPIGPLRLDFGFGDEGGRTHFSIGNVF